MTLFLAIGPKRLKQVALFTTILLACSVARSQPRYRVTTFPTPARYFIASVLNDSNRIAGTVAGGSAWFGHSTQWRPITVSEGQPGWVYGLNNRGDVALDVNVANELRHIVWNNGSYYFLQGTPSASFAKGINKLGQVSGAVTGTSGWMRAATWSSGVLQELLHPLGYVESHGLGINDEGHVFGNASTGIGLSAVLWIDGQPRVIDGPSAYPFMPTAINKHDQVCGYKNGNVYVWSNGVFSLVPKPPGYDLYIPWNNVPAINYAGTVAFTALQGGGAPIAFASNGILTWRLDECLTAKVAYRIQFVYSINNSGCILAGGHSLDNQYSGLLLLAPLGQATPNPID